MLRVFGLLTAVVLQTPTILFAWAVNLSETHKCSLIHEGHRRGREQHTWGLHHCCGH